MKFVVVSFILFTFSILVVQAQTDCAWGYGEEDGPSQWGNICPIFKECSQGTSQSPVNIETDVDYPSMGKPLEQHYLRYPNANVINTGKVLTINVPPFGPDQPVGASLMSGGTLQYDYNLLQLRLRTLSEHTFDGSPNVMEAQFVHGRQGGGTPAAVIAYLFKFGDQADWLQPFVDAIESGQLSTPGVFIDMDVDFSKPLPLSASAGGFSQKYFTYTGSYTTPPCFEIVEWIVVKEVQEISREQWSVLNSLYATGNARPTQALNERTIYQGPSSNASHLVQATFGILISTVILFLSL